VSHYQDRNLRLEPPCCHSFSGNRGTKESKNQTPRINARFCLSTVDETEWFCQLYKAANIVFDIPVGAVCWPASMFKPLIIGIVFPFISSPPWQSRSTPKMFKLGWQLRQVWTGEEMDAGDLLRNFLLEYQRIRTMPPDMVWRVLFFES
jgi:hypothetical protein